MASDAVLSPVTDVAESESRLPDYKPREIPANPPSPRRGGTKAVSAT